MVVHSQMLLFLHVCHYYLMITMKYKVVVNVLQSDHRQVQSKVTYTQGICSESWNMEISNKQCKATVSGTS